MQLNYYLNLTKSCPMNWGNYIEDFEDFPPLTAQMTYSDIGGKSYSKKFKCEVNMRLVNHLPKVLKLNKLDHLDITMYVEPKVIS